MTQAYVGAVPTTGDFKKLDSITTSSATTFNLRQNSVAVYPQSANHCIVSLNGVIQAPGDAFNIVNDTIVFSSSLASTDVINFILVLGNVNDIGTPSDDTVSTAKLQANAVTAAKLNTALLTGHTDIGANIADADLFLIDDGAGGTLRKTAASRLKTYIGGGISNADYWIFKTEQTISATTETTLTGGWAQQTARGGAGGELGTGLSESSGIFSFPSTGIWHIGAWFRVYRNGDSRYINTSMEVTLNNSTYNHMSYGSGFIQQTSSANTTTQINIFGLVDCDNTTNVKFRYRMTSAADVFVSGDPNYSVGGLIAMRLGDT